MKIGLKILAGSIAGLVAILAVSSPAYANVNNFTVTDFTGDYSLSNADMQGELHIVEHIKVNFTDQNHGLLRAIPKSYKSHSLKLHINSISSESGAPTKYSTSTTNGNEVLKIGDPNQTITGAQEYTIDYRIDNVIGFYADHDELYWDINGDQWAQSFQHVTANIHIPSGLIVQKQACYAGTYGMDNKQCSVAKANDTVNVTANGLEASQTLTAVLAFSKGYFAPPTFLDWLRDNYLRVLGVIVPPVVIGGWGFSRWWRMGKDIRGRRTIIPEYSPPDGLGAAEAGIIHNYKLSNRDVSATIIDLAIRKYIRIIEVKKKELFKDKKTYEFELLRTDIDKLKPYEHTVLSDLFLKHEVGERVDLDYLKTIFYKTIQSLQISLPETLTKAGYFTSNPIKAGHGMFVAAGVITLLAFVYFTWLSVGLILSALLLCLFAVLMPKRSAQGVKAKEAIDGLKMYMIVAEKDRIKMLQSPDAPYATKTDAPIQTVELFEKLLPFAIVLGVENRWAQKFESIYTSPPDWYSGNWATFNVLYFASSLDSTVSVMGSSFNPPSSSGAGGFGGGGFSGGGGGGGGGGGW